MQNPLVLIVEDEPQISEIINEYFHREGFRTIVAADGDIALTHFRMMRPDIVILDINLPKRDGSEVLNEIRKISEAPVIMATALGDDLEKISALKIGADDYVVKPFNPLELVARAKAVLRRLNNNSETQKIIRIGDIEIDTDAHLVNALKFENNITSKTRIDVTLTEFRILVYLGRHPKKVFSRFQILDTCLPSDGDALERTVDSHVSKLRKKLEAHDLNNYLECVRGIGYRFFSNED
ncbi:MAG: response regulator transcription factor [Caulobacterales bacterium]|nr:response regulator transcription factor [Caulobacterales bacterium]MCA0373923.1 response regulator [Pseudomonadota bacterium]